VVGSLGIREHSNGTGAHAQRRLQTRQLSDQVGAGLPAEAVELQPYGLPALIALDAEHGGACELEAFREFWPVGCQIDGRLALAPAPPKSTGSDQGGY
jgi:hypothetical protein